MGQLFGVVGEMDESDRHVLMRHALRAKHLRFLRNQNTGHNEGANGGSAGFDGEPQVDGRNRAEQSPSTSEGPRPEPPNISNGANAAELHAARSFAEGGSAGPARESVAKEVSEILHLRRLLDTGKLTREEYLDRLHWH